MVEDPASEGSAPQPIIMEAQGTAFSLSFAEARMAVRLSFSLVHLRAAGRFAEQLTAIESLTTEASVGDDIDRARDLTSAAIILSCAAVEAAIGEARAHFSLGEVGKAKGRKPSTLDLAKMVMRARANDLNLGSLVCQRMRLLVKIRNALVHPVSEWSDEPGKHADLSKEILQQRLTLSPLFPAGNPVFPDRIMSAAIASWSHATAADLIILFKGTLGLQTDGY